MTRSDVAPAKPRLLFVSRKWPPAIGGMETYAVELVESLRQRFEVDTLVLAGRADGSPPGLPAYAAFVFRALLRCLVRGRDYPFVVFGDPVLFPAAIGHYLAARTSTRAVVVYGLDLVYGTRRGIVPWLYRHYLAVLVRCQRVFDHVVAISRYTGELAREAGFKRVSVINPSLPDSALTRARDSHADVQPLLAGFSKVVLCFGRLVPRKGAMWLAEHVLPRLSGDVGLIVAGPATRPEQAELLRSLPRVRYLGPVEPQTLAALIRNANVVAMPNIRVPDAKDVEGFGLVAIEASSLGGRLLASRLDGIRDAVVDGVTGTLVDPGDADAWARAIEASLERESREPAGYRQSVAAATRRAYSRTVQADAFHSLLLGPQRR